MKLYNLIENQAEAALLQKDAITTEGARHPLEETPEASTYERLAKTAQRLATQGLRVDSCASCLHFRFSGMSHDMSSGQAGYCGLVGHRNKAGVVTVGHYCSEHMPDPLWPGAYKDSYPLRAALQNHVPRPARTAAFAGCLVGLAVGDALGFPCEFRSRQQILDTFGTLGVTDFVGIHDKRWPPKPMILGRPHPPGTFSDDTQMSLAVARALITHAHRDLDPLMNEMGRRFVLWGESEDNNRAPGATCMAGVERFAKGAPWQTSGLADSKGCGAAMRTAPIGLVYFRDIERLIEVAKASSLITHGHPTGIWSAAAAALLVALALGKRTPAQMLEQTLARCADSRELCTALRKVPELAKHPPQAALSKDGLGEGWVAEEAVASALYCFWRSPYDFERTVLTAANTDGDSDSIACIAGGISGAFNGIQAIPGRWRYRVEQTEGLHAMAETLEATSQAIRQT